MISGDYSAKKDTQLSLILAEESYINKESEKQLRSRYVSLFLRSQYVAVVSSQFDRR